MERVLVLCQRRASGTDESVHPTVAHLGRYVDALFPATVEYLTSGTQGDYEADYKFKLDYAKKVSDNPDAKAFVRAHKGEYSLVVLNTCPFMFTKFDLVHQLLKSGGVMVVKMFEPHNETGEVPPETRLRMLDDLDRIDRTKDLEKFFVQDTSGRFGAFAFKARRKRKRTKRSSKSEGTQKK